MQRLLSILAPLVATIPLTLNMYAAWWALQYRMAPVGGNQVIDMRLAKSQSPHYITFCAALANNPHGFPGHAMVVWSKTADWNRVDSETTGFVPSYSRDQLASLFTSVPGLLVHGKAGSMINPDAITVIVDEAEYEKTKKMRYQWNPALFRTGVRDCVAFVDFIAQDVGLMAPSDKFTFPQDHIKKLKLLNTKSLTRLARSSAPQARMPLDRSCNFDHADENNDDKSD